MKRAAVKRAVALTRGAAPGTNERRGRRRWFAVLGALVLIASAGAGIARLRVALAPSAGQPVARLAAKSVNVVAFDPVNADLLLLAHDQSVDVSEDGGVQWRDLAEVGTDASQLVTTGANPPRLFVAGHNTFIISVDGGQAWRPQPNNLPSLDLHAFAGSSSDPSRLYAAPMGSGLFASADGGRAWSAVTMPAGPETQPVALAVSPTNPDMLLLARSGQINVSADGGMSWTSQPGPPGIIFTLAAAADADGTLYAGTNQGAWQRRADGSWKRLQIATQGFVVAIAASPSRPERVVIIDSQGNLFRSDDGGNTWASR